MTQTSNRLFDELARLMTDAANVAQGVRREDFDVVRELASKARQENEMLAARVAALETDLANLAGKASKPPAADSASDDENGAKPKRTPRTAKPAGD